MSCKYISKFRKYNKLHFLNLGIYLQGIFRKYFMKKKNVKICIENILTFFNN